MITLYLYSALTAISIPGHLSLDRSILNEMSESDAEDYLNSELNADCSKSDKGALTIKGYNVKFSDFVRSNGKLYELCPQKKIQTLNVFVLNTVFIDMDLDASGDELQLTVIAPAWKVYGRRNINLNGLDGKAHDPPVAKLGEEGDEHGKPGNPGGPGGSFLGIGNSFLNGNNLEISANGGNGGPGQNGANGTDLIIRRPFIPYSTQNCLKGNCDVPKRLLSVNPFDSNDLPRVSTFECVKTNLYEYTYKPVINKDDFQSAGNGGSGGKGGPSGSVLTVELSNFAFISHFNQSGREGAGGNGGIGGKPGGPAVLSVMLCLPSHGPAKYHKWDITIPFLGYAQQPINGLKGTNSAGIQNPAQPKAFPKTYNIHYHAVALIQYKTYLRESSSDPKRTNSLLQFHNLIDRNFHVRRMYTTHGFLSELESLEDHFHTLTINVDFSPFYESLLDRIAVYVDSENPSIQDRKVLAYAYSAILGRLVFLQEPKESILVTDVETYLQLTKKRLDEVKNWNNVRLRDEYHQHVNSKILEAHSLVQSNIMPQILNIEKQMKDSLDYLITEINQHIVTALEEEQEVNELIDQATRQLWIRLGMNIIAATGSILVVIPNIFVQIAGIALSITGTVGKMVVYKDINVPNKTKLPTAVENLNETLQSFHLLEKDRLSKLLDGALHMANKYPERLNSLSRELVQLNKALGQSTSFAEIQAIEKEMRIVVKQKYDELNGYEMNYGPSNFLSAVALRKRRPRTKLKLPKFRRERKRPKKNDQSQEENDASTSLEIIMSLLDLGSGVYDIYKDFMEDGEKVNTLNDLLSKIKDKIKKIYQYLRAVYSVLSPLLDDLARTISNLSQNLENLSQVALIVAKYDLKKLLESTTEFITDFTEEFEAQGMFRDILNNMQGTFDVLFSVFNQIQEYVREMNLANQMADLVSEGVTKIAITDTNYVQRISNLAITISSNVVLMYYKPAVSAFKQFVFPFAHDYFNELVLPRSLVIESNLTDLVISADLQIHHLIDKLQYYKSILKTGHSESVHRTNFNSFRPSTKPFFIWKNGVNREMISKLLSGQEVVAYADIKESFPFKDAIKFSEVGIYLKAKNKTAQTELNKCLETLKITMLHFGDSYYRYNRKFYLITSSSVRISFSFDNENGEPIDRSDTYDKIKLGTYMLSPYALWKLKISFLYEQLPFDNLKAYENEIDVELVGKGSYIDSKELSRIDLKEGIYYKPLNAYESLKRRS